MSQRIHYLHNIFRNNALHFYYRNVQGRVLSFKDQSRKWSIVLILLKTAENQISFWTTRIFSSRTNETNRLYRGKILLCLPNFEEESHSSWFLRQTVIEYELATFVLCEVNPETRFEALYSKLDNALQVYGQRNTEKRESDSFIAGINFDEEPDVLFAQLKYQK